MNSPKPTAEISARRAGEWRAFALCDPHPRDLRSRPAHSRLWFFRRTACPAYHILHPLMATLAGKPARGLLPNIRVLKTPLGWIAGRITPLPVRTARIFAAEPIISPARFARGAVLHDSCVLTPWDLDCGTDYADARMERKGHCFEPANSGDAVCAAVFYCGFAHVEATRRIRLARA